MFAHLLSLTSFVSHRFETPLAGRWARVPDVTEWLVPVSVGMPLLGAPEHDNARTLEAADEEVTERDPIAVGWRLASLEPAQA